MRRDRRFRFTASHIPAANPITGARPRHPALTIPRRKSAPAGVSRTALAALLIAQPVVTAPALAAGFAGTPNVAFGNVTFDRSPANSETISVNSAQATVNWTPTDNTGTGNINFLPGGNSAVFSSNLGSATILNRIIASNASRIVELNGSISSPANVGVWFYAPGGLLIGGSARFDVGSLLLTTSDPVRDAAGNFLRANRSFTLSQASVAGAGITIANGAVINANLAANSYVVAVAPKVTQAGSIAVNGSAALVAADAVDISMNAGLFDIAITSGTSAADQVLTHTGTTAGPAAQAGANNRIYLVAVPKNDAITMFIGNNTSLGFDIAGAADVVGNTIVLSAGHNVKAVASGDPFSDTPVNAVAANIAIGTSDFSSSVTGRATTNAGVSLVGTGSQNLYADFASNLTLRAGSEASIRGSGLIGSGYGAYITVNGDLLLSADAQFLTPASALTRTAGTATIGIGGAGSLYIGGALALSASGYGDLGGSGNGVGGTANIVADGGSITVAGSGASSIKADGFGSSGPAPGTGKGGFAQIQSQDAGNAQGSITFTGNLLVSANGTGGGNSVGIGADGTGGTSEVRVSSDGNLALNGGIAANAMGFGGNGQTGGGIGQGGAARILATSGTVGLTGPASISAGGEGGNGTSSGNGGAAFGGTATASTAAGGSLQNVSGGLSVAANANGGDAVAGTAGNALGGTAQLLAPDGQITVFNGDVVVSAVAQGGSGVIGGNGVGGNAVITADGNGFIGLDTVAGSVTATATGYGAYGDTTGGAGTGGSALIQASNGGFLRITGIATAQADALGGFGATGNGGSGTGGTAVITAFGSESFLTIHNDNGGDGAVSSAFGTGGNSGDAGIGGSGFGGTARIVERLGADIAIGGEGGQGIAINNAHVVMDATGGYSSNGQGGSATAGGYAGLLGDISADGGGSLTITGNALGSAIARGGSGATLGNATGGRFVLLNQTGSTLDVGGDATINVTALISGEGGGTAGIGGNAIGGTGQIGAGNGRLHIGGNVQIDASAFGGYQAGHGGNATGGLSLLSTFASGGEIVIDGAQISLVQVGGGGGSDSTTGIGGTATGGIGQIDANNGIIRTTQSDGNIAISINSVAEGGSGANGGDAFGGRAIFSAHDGGSVSTSYRVQMLAVTTGGSSTSSTGGSGGNATGATADTAPAAFLGTSGTTDSTIDISGNVEISAVSLGGSGSFSGTSGGGNAVGGRSFVHTANGSLTIGGTFNAFTNATGGNGLNGGNAAAGTNYVSASSSTIAINGGGFSNAGATGGRAYDGTGGTGGNALGGSVYWSSIGTATTRGILSVATLNIDASAVGGDGGRGGGTLLTGGAGGSATGTAIGTAADGFGIFVTARGTNAELTTGSLNVYAIARGGDGGFGGSVAQGMPGSNGGAGGAAIGINSNFGTVSTNVGAPVNTTVATLGDVNFTVTAYGGTGGIASDGSVQGIGGRGGDSTGATAVLLGRGSTVSAGTIGLNVQAFGGAGGTGYGMDLDAGGGNAIGGAGGVVATPHFVSGNPVTMTTGDIYVDASARGGNSGVQGGNAIGGDTFVTIDRQVGGPAVSLVGTITTSNITLNSDANGGNASGLSQGGRGGNATGGTSSVTSTADATATFGGVRQTAYANGGQGGTGRRGVDGAAGANGVDGLIPTNGGDGQNGTAGGAGGAGGNAVGGALRFGMTSTTAGGSISANALEQYADANGGRGGTGGDGGTGGRGGDGGNATGGENNPNVPGGNGGRGGDGGATGIGGAGGTATGGKISIGDLDAASVGGNVSVSSLIATARADGGEGGRFGYSGYGDGGNGGSGFLISGNPGGFGNFGLLAASGDGGSAIGGAITVVSTSSLTIGSDGYFQLVANAGGGDVGGLFGNYYGAPDTGVGGNALGGTIAVSAVGGAIQADGLYASASGRPGFSLGTNVATGTGGSVDVLADAGGRISLITGPSLYATGDPVGSEGASNYGANGAGGRVSLRANGSDNADNFSTITIDATDQTTLLDASAEGSYGYLTGGVGTGGQAMVEATNGASIVINGSLTVRAYGDGGAARGIGGNGVSGAVRVSVGPASTLSVSQSLLVDASARGGDGEAQDGEFIGGGNALAGNADAVNILNNGTISVGGNVLIDASGYGGGLYNNSYSEATGGQGYGGRIVFDNAGGDFSSNGTFTISAKGVGGSADSETGIGGGADGSGGQIYLTLRDGGSFTLPNSSIYLDVTGTGGDGGNDGALVGAGYGGTISARIDNTDFTGARLGLNADGSGGVNLQVGSPDGFGQGGYASLDLYNASVSLSDDIQISAFGSGGGANGGTAILTVLESTLSSDGAIHLDAAADAGSGYIGDATGGTAQLLFRGSAIDLRGSTPFGEDSASLVVDAGASGRSATGGTVTIGTAGSGAPSSLTLQSGLIASASANGSGGGTATGGNIAIDTANGDEILGDIRADANADASYNSSQGGDAFGGSVTVTADAGRIAGSLSAAVAATGGANSFGDGGNATGGTIVVTAAGGTLEFGTLDLYAAADAGSSDSATGGSARAGSITLSNSGANIGAISADELFIGLGASAGSGGSGGSAVGGTLTVTADGDGFNLGGPLSADLGARGANGGNGDQDGNGGDGAGGVFTLDLRNGAAFNVDGAINTDGTGGNGYGVGNGGTGTGGRVSLTFDGTATGINITELIVTSNGIGGAAGDNEGGGGSGIGGRVDLVVSNGASLATEGNLSLSATGVAGPSFGKTNGEIYDGAAGAGGTINLTAANGAIFVGGNLDLQASGTGGTSDNGLGGAGTGGTANIAIFNTVNGSNGGITVDGDASLIASGTGADDFSGAGGGDGSGGTATIAFTGGTSLFRGEETRLDASGMGFNSLGGTAGVTNLAGGGSIGFSGPLTIDAHAGARQSGQNATGGTTNLSIASGASVDVQSGALLDSSAYTAFTDGGRMVGGTATLAIGGVGSFGGDISIDAYARTFGSTVDGGSAQGGRIVAGVAPGGSLQGTGSIYLDASAEAGDGDNGGNAIGGDIRFVASSGDIGIGGTLRADASALGGDGNADNGGTALGGNILIAADPVNNGPASISSASLDLNAAATGGDGAYESGGNGGEARGGTVAITIASGGGSITVQQANVQAQGFGGTGYTGGNGGNAFGGAVTVSVSGDSVFSASESAQFSYDAVGGSASYGYGSITGAGGEAIGGSGNFSADSLGAIAFDGGAMLSGRANGGRSDAGNGGNAAGGDTLLALDSGSLTSGAGLSIDATGQGGNYNDYNSGGSGDGVGGNVRVTAIGASSLAVASDLNLTASGSSDGRIDGETGNGIGGTALLSLADTSTANIGGNVSLIAIGSGNGARSGSRGPINGQGGTVQILNGGPLLAIGGDTSLDASGIGSAGGSGIGGTARLDTGAGTTTINGAASLVAAAFAASNSPDNGGNATGGVADVTVGSGTLTVGAALMLDGSAIAGDGANGSGSIATGGTARAGTSQVTSGGVLRVGEGLLVNQSATGGGGFNALSGDATGGSITVNADGGMIFVTAGDSRLDASALAGSTLSDGEGTFGTGNAGNATGGTVSLTVTGADAVFSNADALAITTLAQGGAGDAGGFGYGGNVNVASTGGTLLVGGPVTIDGSGLGGAGAAGNGGDAAGGIVTVQLGGGTLSTASLTITADGTGGTGTDSDGTGAGGSAAVGVGPAGDPNGDNSLSVGALVLTANGTTNTGRVSFSAFGGSAFADSVSLTTLGAGPATVETPYGASGLFGRDGTIAIAGSATINVADFATLGMDNGSISIGQSLDVLSASGIVASADGALLQNPGTVTTGLDLSLSALAGGIDNAVTLNAGRALFVNADVADIILGDSSAGTAAVITAQQGSVTTGNIASMGDIAVSAATSLSGGDAIGNGVVELRAATIDIGNASGNSVGLIALTGPLSAGDIAVQTDAALLSGGNVQLGSLNAPDTGRILIANASMASLITTPGDYAPLFGAAIARTSGDISINGDVNVGTLVAAATGLITISGASNITDTLRLTANSLDLADLTLGGDLELTTDAALGVGDVLAGGGVILTSGTTVSAGSITAADSIVISAANTVATDNLRAGGDIDIRATDSLTTGTVSAGNRVFLRAAAGESDAPILATGDIDAGIIDPAGGNARYSVYVDSVGSTDLGAITAAGSIGVIAQNGALSTGALTAGSTVVLLDGAGVTTGAISTPASGGVYIASHAQAPLITFDINGNPDYAALFQTVPQRLVGGITINGDVDTGLLLAAATGVITIDGDVTAARGLRIDGGNLVLGGLTSGGFLQLLTDTDLTLGDIRAESDVDLFAIGNIRTGRISAGDSVFVTARAGEGVGGAITTGDIDAGILRPAQDEGARYGVAVDGAGPVSLGNVDARGAVGAVARGSNLSVGAINAGQSVGLLAATGVSTGAIRTAPLGVTLIASDTMADLIVIDANGDIDYSVLAAATPVALGGPVTLGGRIDTGALKIATTGAITGASPINAAGFVTVRGGPVSLANVNSGGPLFISAADTLVLGNVRAEGDVDIEGAASITTGTVSAGDSVSIGMGDFETNGGSITTGDIDAGILRPSTNQDAGYQVGIGAGRGNVSTGRITARGNVGLRSLGGAISIGGVSTTGSLGVLASTGFASGAVTTGSNGTVYIANSSGASGDLGLDALGPPSAFDLAPIFALTPVRIAGPVTLSGPVSTGRFTASSTGGFAAQAITASQSVTVDSGGLADFTGQVTSPTITVTSADIGIGANAGLGTANTSQVTLNIASNANAITIGGSGEASGYYLSNAEAGRIRARALTIAALGTEPAQMTVQTLGLTGSGASSEGNSVALLTPGRIRVEGPLTLTGAGAGDTLRLNAGQRIEVVTDRGGKIALGSSGDTLAGTLSLTSGAIWVGTSDLIGQLTQNASFAGRDAALAAVPATPDLVGALSAGNIAVSAGSSFLVQNSGSAVQRAGFSAGSGGMRIASTGSSPLDVVINGRILGTSGSFLINDDTITAITFGAGEGGNTFTATSTVNGCVVGGSCGVIPDEPVTQDVLAIITNVAELANRIEKSPEEQQEEARDAAEKLPQLRIERLIDLSSAIDDVIITDPVTGGGNPALWLDQTVPARTGGTGGLK